MRFTVAPRRAALPAAPPRPRPALAPLGKLWRDYTAPGCYEPVKAVTADGEWLFERNDDGSWATGHLPTETVVKERVRSLRACRAYVASGAAQADLEQIREETSQ